MSDTKVKERLQEIVGCRIKTHYNTGGIVTAIHGPYGSHFTLNYEDERDGHRCIINTIRLENGVITCEGKPLKILDRVRPSQLELF